MMLRLYNLCRLDGVGKTAVTTSGRAEWRAWFRTEREFVAHVRRAEERKHSETLADSLSDEEKAELPEAERNCTGTYRLTDVSAKPNKMNEPAYYAWLKCDGCGDPAEVQSY